MPLYQHNSRQKIIIPTGVNSTNYSTIVNAGSWSVTTESGNALRIKSLERGPAYGYNAWIRYIPGVPTGSKTITILFRFNSTGANNIGNNSFGILLSDGGTKATSTNAWSGIGWRSITWLLNSPNGAPTSYTQNGTSYSGFGWLDTAYTLQSGTSYGLRITDNGSTGMTFQRSVDGGSSWLNTTSPSYGNTGLGGSPTQFGFFALPTNTATDGLFDVTVTSVTIT